MALSNCLSAPFLKFRRNFDFGVYLVNIRAQPLADKVLRTTEDYVNRYALTPVPLSFLPMAQHQKDFFFT